MDRPLSAEEIARHHSVADPVFLDQHMAIVHLVNNRAKHMRAGYRPYATRLATKARDLHKKYGNALPQDELRAFIVDIDRTVHGLGDESRERYQSHMRSMLRRIAREVAGHLRTRGFDIRTKQAIAIAEDAWSSLLPQVEYRVRTLDLRFFTALSKRVQVWDSSSASGIMDMLMTGVGGAEVPGGSLLRMAQKILVSDFLSAAQTVRHRVYSNTGIGWAWWRLSRAHGVHGRLEACEELATARFSEVRLLNLGAPAGADPSGLYPLSHFPELPHPFCRCWSEPVVI